MVNTKDRFNLDYGSKSRGIKVEEIKLELMLDEVMEEYAKAYYYELNRHNPNKFEVSDLTEKEVYDYFRGLMAIRIASVGDQGYKFWRQAKELLVPAWIQFVLTQYGILFKPEIGISIIPIVAYEPDINAMLVTSRKLSSFKADGIFLEKDAIPRAKEGDEDVMMMAVFGSEVRGMMRESEPSPTAQLVVGFVNAKLQEETSVKALYRITYDDTTFIRQMIINDERLFI